MVGERTEFTASRMPVSSAAASSVGAISVPYKSQVNPFVYCQENQASAGPCYDGQTRVARKENGAVNRIVSLTLVHHRHTQCWSTHSRSSSLNYKGILAGTCAQGTLQFSHNTNAVDVQNERHRLSLRFAGIALILHQDGEVAKFNGDSDERNMTRSGSMQGVRAAHRASVIPTTKGCQSSAARLELSGAPCVGGSCCLELGGSPR